MKLLILIELPHLLTLLTTVIVILEGVSVSASPEDFQLNCDEHIPCPKEFLKCVNFSCECESEDQVFDSFVDQCVSLAGKPCMIHDIGKIAMCVQGAECSETKGICECSKRFYETDLNLCSYAIGKSCRKHEECDKTSGLFCQGGMCRCFNSSYVWQLEHGCITWAGINNVIPIHTTPLPKPTTTTEKAELLPLGESTTYRIGNKGTTASEQSNTDEGVEEMMETTTIIDDTKNHFGGPSLQDIFNQVVPPILNPNHNKKQKPIRDPQTSGGSSGEKITQANVFNPAPLPSDIANPSFALPTAGPLHLLNLRRLTRPLKRFFFPRLFSEDEKAGTATELPFPSPIWLMVSTINQVLPVLRVIDHQTAPVLRYLAAVSRPKHLDKLFGGDLNDHTRLGRHALSTTTQRRHPFYDWGKVRHNENMYFPSLAYPRVPNDDID